MAFAKVPGKQNLVYDLGATCMWAQNQTLRVEIMIPNPVRLQIHFSLRGILTVLTDQALKNVTLNVCLNGSTHS